MLNPREKKTHVFTTTHRQDEINNDLAMPRRDRSHYNQRQEYRRPNAFISAILALCAIFFLCLYILSLVLRTANIPHIIQQTDFVGILDSVAVGEHSYYIVDQLNALPFHGVRINLYDVDHFIRTDTVSHEIGNIINEYAREFSAGNLDHHLTTDDVINASRNLEPEFNEFFGHQMTDADREMLAMRLDDIIDFSSLSVSGIMYDLDVGMTVPRAILSSSLSWVVGLISALFLLLIFLIRIRSIPNAILATGVPIVIAGCIVYAIGLFIGAVPAMFGSTIQNILSFLNGPVQLITRYGLNFIIIGVVVIAVALVLKVVSNSRGRRYA